MVYLPTFQWKALFLGFCLALPVLVALLLVRVCHFELVVSYDINTTSSINPQLRFVLSIGTKSVPNSTRKENTTFTLLGKGSSVYCFGKNKRDRICRFKNLCYSSKFDNYIFFHGGETSQQGLPRNRHDPALLDLTSVDDHNTQYFNFVDFPASSIGVHFHDIELKKYPALLFHRFNPSNLMHVIHDDLLPLWLTIKLSFASQLHSSLQLVMMDGRDQGPWFELYQFFSKNIFLKADALNRELVCFTDIVVGLSKESTWYQYGFKVPQGPIADSKASRYHLSLFAEEFLSHYECKKGSKHNVVLISRKQSRCILNEMEVSIALANYFKMEVTFLDFELHVFNEAICMVRNSVALVGMHGAELSLALFLQPGSAVVELFPYGVKPDQYTPYRTLAAIQGLQYVSWQNSNPRNTLSYPNRPPELGGISHLSKSMQDKILSSTEIPEHLCCSNPFWLHRIYQDTMVDTSSLEISLSMLKSNIDHVDQSQQPVLYPDAVQQPTCYILKHEDGRLALRIKWLPPINAKYIGGSNLKYQVLIQRDEDINVSAYELGETEFSLENIAFDKHCKLWIRCILKDIVGPLSTTVSCVDE